MPLNKESIGPLLASFSTFSPVLKRNLGVPDLEDSDFSRPAPGYTLWRWGALEPSDRGKLTFLFRDSDGVNVFLSIVADKDNRMREIEFWRGDGGDLQRLPNVDELIQPEVGKTY